MLDSKFKDLGKKKAKKAKNVFVAQLNRATGCGPVGRGFESLRARHLIIVVI